MQIGLHFGQEICRACRSSAINSCTLKESDNEGGWVDEDADGVASELSSNKKRKKTFTAIDKVRIMLGCVLYLLIEEVDSCYCS